MTGQLNNNSIATERGLRYPTSPNGSILGYSSTSSHQVSDIGLTHTAPGSLLCGRSCVCVLGLGSLPQTPHELSGEPRSGAHAPCLWAWLTYPTADASGAPDTVLCAAHPGGEQQGMCVCVCVWGYSHPSARGVPQLDSNQPSSGWGWGLQSCSPLNLGAHPKSPCCPTHRSTGELTEEGSDHR